MFLCFTGVNLRDKTKADKLMYIPNHKQINLFLKHDMNIKKFEQFEVLSFNKKNPKFFKPTNNV